MALEEVAAVEERHAFAKKIMGRWQRLRTHDAPG
jgi:hypothetical protein